MKTEKAFTLIEMLIVLMMIMLLTLLLVPSMYEMIRKYEVKTFFKHLEADLLYIQNETMTSGESYSIVLLKNGESYLVINSHRFITKEVPVPKGLIYSSSDLTLSFNKRGTLVNPRTILFKDGEDTYSLTMPLGKGGYYFEKNRY